MKVTRQYARSLLRSGCLSSPPHTTWSRRQDSNPRPTDYKSAALPTELRRPNVRCHENGAQHHCETLCASACHSLNSTRIRSLTSYAKLSWSPWAGRTQANSSISRRRCQHLTRRGTSTEWVAALSPGHPARQLSLWVKSAPSFGGHPCRLRVHSSSATAITKRRSMVPETSSLQSTSIPASGARALVRLHTRHPSASPQYSCRAGVLPRNPIPAL
jgi:hypothetical protein